MPEAVDPATALPDASRASSRLPRPIAHGSIAAPPMDPSRASSSDASAAATVAKALARASWLGLGAVVGTAVTLMAVLRPFAKHDPGQGAALPYETFPFANNAGVCQEFVALASTLGTSRVDARDIARRLVPSLPPGVRAENLRVVRAFAPGDDWTIAVDTQPGAGDLVHARTTADAMNAIPGTGIRFEGVFYSPRRLYDTAGVLCMPHDGVPPPR